MTETTTPTPEQMRLYARMLRLDASGEAGRMDSTHMYAVADALDAIAASALDAKGETTGEEGDGYDGVIRARNYFAAPPLAPSSEPKCATCRDLGYLVMEGGYASPCSCRDTRHAAPREPQPSSERLDPLQVVGPAPGTMHPVNQPASEASAPLSVHPSHVMETQRASKMASCVNCDRPLDWPCDINNQREPREPHAALLKEIEGVIAEDGFSGGPDKRKSTGKLEAWCPECSSYREEGHDEDCRWLRDHKLLRRCKAAILGGQGCPYDASTTHKAGEACGPFCRRYKEVE